VVDHGAIYPHAPRKQWQKSIDQLAAWIRRHQVTLVAIGNGTASRETEKLVADLCRQQPDLKLNHLLVNEAGASVYSASEYASRELPDLDVTIRGAVSIARRLQDPLAELVKIEPKAIGVGQYQHDVSQVQLARSLDAVVEDCVNAVGVDANTASAPLLARVAGLNSVTAQNLVAYRNDNGPFKSRRGLMKVPRLGDKAFEQSAGFLRIMGGENPLDASAVHPEAYRLVESIAKHQDKPLRGLIGNPEILATIRPEDHVTERFGLPTVRDILAELEKPGRDPRPEFRFARFKEGVDTLEDLQPGMVLEGSVTNVTNFGAFVDIGVHQDGLVHISALSTEFVRDPREKVKAGDIVTVKVMEVDAERRRIALTMRLQDEPGDPAAGAGRKKREAEGNRPPGRRDKKQGQNKRPDKAGTAMGGALAQAMAKARNKR